MIELKTRFNALRLVSGQKEPMLLEVTVNNPETVQRLVSITVKAPFALGFDKIGLMREQRKRVGYVKENSKQTVEFPIYGKPGISEGTYELKITAMVHPDRYDKEGQTVTTTANMRVIKR